MGRYMRNTQHHCSLPTETVKLSTKIVSFDLLQRYTLTSFSALEILPKCIEPDTKHHPLEFLVVESTLKAK